MWIFLHDAFLSIVAPNPLTKKNKDKLVVRARCAGDIERVFWDAIVTSEKGRDYGFRAVIPQAQVVSAMTREVKAINYTNFKNEVKEKDRHDAYLKVWSAMFNLQTARDPSLDMWHSEPQPNHIDWAPWTKKGKAKKKLRSDDPALAVECPVHPALAVECPVCKSPEGEPCLRLDAAGVIAERQPHERRVDTAIEFEWPLVVGRETVS
jgi:hypothetical protein